jgi:origin recognition complex subunit 3
MTQGAYIYQPKHGKAGERPSKRRKVSGVNLDNKPNGQRFVPLLNGEESAESVQLRYDTYKKIWSKQENKIQVSWTTRAVTMICKDL